VNLGALFAAPLAVQVHALCALAAIVLGAVQLAAPKGSGWHRAMGWTWVALMTATAVSSFVFVGHPAYGGLGPIHLLSVLTLFGLVDTVRFARSRQIARHRSNAILIYLLALILTGAFTLLPGRLMHCVAFGPDTADCPRPS
jgi:uncharacterized membrane protein